MKPVNTLLTLGVVVGGVWALFEWLKTQCAQGSGSILMGSPVCSTFTGIFTPVTAAGTITASGSAASPVPAPVAVQATPVQSIQQQFQAQPVSRAPSNPILIVPVERDRTSQPSVPTVPVVTRQRTQPTTPGPFAYGLLTTAGITDPSTLMNVDQWSYYWTQAFNETLSADSFTAAFPQLTATDRLSLTAQEFADALTGRGMSGMIGPHVPAYLVHDPTPPMSYPVPGDDVGIWGRLVN